MILFDTETRERIGEYQAPGVVTWLGFHPRDGSLAIVGGVTDPSGKRHTCTSSTPPPNGRAARSRSAAIPPTPGRDLHPLRNLRPGRTERDRGLYGLLPRRDRARVPAPLRRPQRLADRTGRSRRPPVCLGARSCTPPRTGACSSRATRRPTRSTRTRCASCAAIRSALTPPVSAPTAPRSRSAARTDAFACSTSPPGGCGR